MSLTKTSDENVLSVIVELYCTSLMCINQTLNFQYPSHKQFSYPNKLLEIYCVNFHPIFYPVIRSSRLLGATGDQISYH